MLLVITNISFANKWMPNKTAIEQPVRSVNIHFIYVNSMQHNKRKKINKVDTFYGSIDENIYLVIKNRYLPTRIYE